MCIRDSTLGIGLDGIRKISVNDKFEMIPTDLENKIKEDIYKGNKPFCVVATVGTTSTTVSYTHLTLPTSDLV